MTVKKAPLFSGSRAFLAPLIIVVLFMSMGVGSAFADDEDCSDQRQKAEDLFVDPPKNTNEAMSASYIHFTLVSVQKDKKTILMWGGVCDGDAERVRKVLEVAKPIGEVWFFSPGGALEEGLQIGRIIRKNSVRTRVPARYQCISACNFMFMGGIIRYIEPGGAFGVHMFANSGITSHDAKVIKIIVNAEDLSKSYNEKHPDQPVTPEKLAGTILLDHNKEVQQTAAQIAAEIARFLVEMQLSLRFLTEFANIPNENYRVLRRDELRDFNIINTD